MLNKSVKISIGDVNKKLFAHLFDLLFILICSFGVYFSCFYGISVPTTNYNQNQILINDTLESHGMTVDHPKDYKAYEEVCQDFYFNAYPNELVNYFYNKTGERLSIKHIYNIQVLGLVKDPTLDNYNKDDYFSYKIDGNVILVDEIATTKESFGPTFDRNIKKIFRNGYDALFTFLMQFDKAYSDAKITNRDTRGYARIFAATISVLIFALIIPISLKNKVTLGETIMGLANVNVSDGYIVPIWKPLLRPLILYTLPIVAMYFGSIYAIVILAVAPIFFNILTMILTKDNLDITQKILRMDLAYVKDSLIFKNKNDEIEYLNSEEYKHIEDADYLAKLAGLKEVDLSESRSEQINKNKDKNKNEKVAK